jgi:SpoVK/Ycf46/Vps4 family AAA+-type ATPase
MLTTENAASAGSLYREANEYFEKSMFERAIPLYTQAIARSPKNNKDLYKYFYNRGLCHCCMERYGEGKLDLLKALGLKPHFAEGWYILGLCKEYLQDLDGATEAYDRALIKNPDFKDAQNRKEMVESRRRRGYSSLVSRASTAKGESHENDAALEHVRSLEDQGRFQEALELLEETLCRQPDDFKLLLARRVLIAKITAFSKPDVLCGMEDIKDVCDREFLSRIENFEHPLYRVSIVQSSVGMILHGPPGCGKSSLIASIAKDNGIELVEIILSEILNMWSGESEKRLTQIFDKVKEIAKSGRPVILLVDELDSLGLARSVTVESGEMCWSRDLRNTFRRLLDEVKSTPNLVIVGVTNYLWSVDGALRRPGRMGASIVYIPPPDAKTREEIFRLYSAETPGHENLDHRRLAEDTQGFSGDEIRNVCREVHNEVARRIVRKEKKNTVAAMKDYERFIHERIPTCLSWIQDVARAWIEGRIRDNEVEKRLMADIEKACPNAMDEKEKVNRTQKERSTRKPEYVI